MTYPTPEQIDARIKAVDRHLKIAYAEAQMRMRVCDTDTPEWDSAYTAMIHAEGKLDAQYIPFPFPPNSPLYDAESDPYATQGETNE